MVKQKKVECSDWHRSWMGLIGELFTTETENRYIWKGEWHGSHGQTGTPYKVLFEYDGETGDIKLLGGSQEGRLPHTDDVKEAIRKLKNS